MFNASGINMTGSGQIQQFKFFCQKILPLVYDDALSYYEVLCKVSEKLNEVVVTTNDVTQMLEIVNTEITKIESEVEALQTQNAEFAEEIESIKRGDYVPLYLDSISNWIDKNLIDVIGRSASFIVFGLSDDGYFVAYVPEGWDFITFDTDGDFDSPNYGKLILEY